MVAFGRVPGAACDVVFGPGLLSDLFFEEQVFLLPGELEELEEDGSGHHVLDEFCGHGLHLGAGQRGLLEELKLLHALREDVAVALEVRQHLVELALQVLVELLVVQLVEHAVDWVSRAYRSARDRSL